MKRFCVIVMLLSLLSGCKYKEEPISKAMDLREAILSSDGTSFLTSVTADYDDLLYTFVLDCREDGEGNLSFTVTEPKSILGITGIITNEHPSLTFDDKVLAFPPLSDGQVSPVMAPYILLQALRGGYISACGVDGDGYCIYIDDSFLENQLHFQIFTDATCTPIRAEIIFGDYRILTLDIQNFVLL